MPKKINSNEDQRRYVLDSYALLAYFEGDPEGGKVEKLLKSALYKEVEIFMNVINLGEVIYITERERGLSKAQEVLARIGEFPIAIVEVDRELALMAAHLKAKYPIAYADCLAAALAQLKGAILVTGDPEFKRIKPEDSPSLLWLREI